MTDAPFVVAAYLVVLGGLAGYAFTLARRTAAAVRLLASADRDRDVHGMAEAVGGPATEGRSRASR